MKTIKASIANMPYKTEITTKDHVFYADEPVDLGGKNLAPTPYEMLVGSLASCTVITMRMYANRKNWDIKEIKVDVQYDQDTHTVVRRIELIESSDEVNKDRMLLIANKCPIHKLLDPVMDIQTSIV